MNNFTEYSDINYDTEPDSISDDLDYERARVKWEAAIGYRIFAANRWGQLGDGHITARDPILSDHFWVLAYGVAFHRASVDQMVLVSPQREIVIGPTAGGVNHAGFNIHYPIYDSLPEVHAAAHTHTGYGTAFSAEVRPFQAISQEACTFVLDQTIYEGEDLEVSTTDGGYRIAKSMSGQGRRGRDARLCILRNHGLLTAGASPAHAVGCFVMAERVAEVHIKAREAVPISPESAIAVAENVAGPSAGWLAFQWLARDLVPDPSVVLEDRA